MPSVYDYQISQQLAVQDLPFYGLLFALIRRADTRNTELIRQAWPEVYDEFVTRYNSPGGWLPGEHLA